MSAPAKVHRTDSRQTLKLPAGFELSAEEDWVRRDEETGDIILTPKRARPDAEWVTKLFALLEAAPLPDDFLRERPNPALTPRNPLDDWSK